MRRFRRRERERAWYAVSKINQAWIYLYQDFWRWASTKDRDGLTSVQWDALQILNRLHVEALNHALEVSR